MPGYWEDPDDIAIADELAEDGLELDRLQAHVAAPACYSCYYGLHHNKCDTRAYRPSPPPDRVVDVNHNQEKP